MYDPSIFGHGFLKTEARILGFGTVGVWNMELVMEFTGDQMEMILELTSELIGDPDGCPLTSPPA